MGKQVIIVSAVTDTEDKTETRNNKGENIIIIYDNICWFLG